MSLAGLSPYLGVNGTQIPQNFLPPGSSPATHQICIRTLIPSTSMVFILKSTPGIGMGEAVGCPGVFLCRSCCHWEPAGPLPSHDPLHAPPWPGAGPHTQCLAWQQALVPGGDPGAPSFLVLQLSCSPTSPELRLLSAVAAKCFQFPAARCSRFPVPEVPGPPGSPVPMIFCLPDVPGSLEPRLSGASGFLVSRWSRLVDAHGFTLSRCSRLPGSPVQRLPMLLVPRCPQFSLPRCPRFSRSLVASSPRS